MNKTYTCPMHPEVTSDKPGRCPKCGMDLESQEEDNEDEPHQNHAPSMEQDFKKRFFIALPLTFIVLALSPKIQEWLAFSIKAPTLIIFAITSTIVFYAGLPFYQMAKGEIKSRNFGMMTLVSLAVLSGYFFSVAATFLFKGESLYWEISTLVLAFLFGHWMEMRAVRTASSALTEIAKLIPKTAHVVKGKEIIDIKTEELKKGDLILIKPGEKIPIDGEVVEGESSANESMITGESKPVPKKVGDEVIGGTINNDGSLTVKVTKVGRGTVISQMQELIRSAQETKPQVQMLADKAASLLTFIAIGAGSLTFIYWFFISPQGAVFAMTLAISTIVITCPHALGLAIPTVTTITSTLASKNGILIRDMKALEIARRLTYVIFDKTGTLTEGRFGITSVTPATTSISKNDVISLAAAVEFHSQHSIAQGILQEAQKRKIKFSPAVIFQSFPGKGAKGRINGNEILVGNQILMSENKIDIESIKKESTGTFIIVAKNKQVVGIIGMEDVVRKESQEAIKAIKDLGIKTAMLTGDKKEIADIVAQELDIDTVFAEVLPKDKVAKVKQLQEEGNIVAMVGDGVNDAPSLTQAHVGIAIGAGTGVAIESAQIILVKNDPRDVIKAIKLSQKTDLKMKQNLAWAAGYNIFAIPIAAGLLYRFGILLKPEWSALLMSASSIIVVFNALLLKRADLNP